MKRNVRTQALAVATIAAAVALSTPGNAAIAAPTSACPLPRFGPGDEYRPVVDPTTFGPDVDNPYAPMTPGIVLVYAGTKDGKIALDLVAASNRTKVVAGVTTRVVEDRLYLDGRVEETTSDYYAQDTCGNVWYFGEDTAALDRHGRVVSRDGSFLAGVDGARPGVYMQAHPQLGRRFRQEWSPGNAEDQFAAVDLSTKATTPAGTFRHALRTREVTDLEPGVVDNKVFAKGVGEVLETTVRGPKERLELIEVLDLRA